MKIATITLKETGLTYEVYPVKSFSGAAEYKVWVINHRPTHCTCKARKFNPHKLCKHMQEWMQENLASVA